jgi:ABC-type multidrug transport system fused ATPase/permease subunit
LMGMKQRYLLPALLAVVGFCHPAPAAAQQPAAPAPPAAASETVRVVHDAESTREQLRNILAMYPEAVGEILRRDPSLMSRADYMASYPQLSQFIAQHPEIPRNVEYYLDGYGRYQNRHRLDPEYEALGVLLGGLAGFLAAGAMIGVLTWLVRSFIQHRRWIKASQIQADVHSKLMDRMTSNEELLTYIQSAAGRNFLEASPIRPEPDGPAYRAPVGPILWSMMAGVVLSTVGAGFRVASSTISDDVQRAFTVVGIILLSLGIGFLIASLMAFMVSSRLGLFPSRTAPTSDSGHA